MSVASDRHEVPRHLDAPEMFGLLSRPQVERLVVAIGAATLVWLPLHSFDGWLTLALVVVCGLLGLLFAFWRGRRPLAEQLQVWAHYATLPQLAGPIWSSQRWVHLERVDEGVLESTLGERYRAVVSVGPRNLRLVGPDESDAAMQQFIAFLNGLSFPVQVVARAVPVDLDDALAELEARTDTRATDLAAHLRAQAETHALLERQRLVVVAAATADLLVQRVDALLEGIQRAGLRGHRLNGELRDVLQACWSPEPAGEAVGPHLVRVERDQLVVDGQYVRTLVGSLPGTVWMGWAGELFDGRLPVDVVLHITPLRSADEAKRLDRQIVKWQSSNLADDRAGRGLDPERLVALEHAERLRMALARGEERLFRVGLYVLLRAPTLAELDARERSVRDTLDELLGDAHAARWEHDRGLQACVPQGADPLNATTVLDTSSLARTYPWSAGALVHGHGVPLGVAIGSTSPVWVDPWHPELSNAHLGVFAMSGAGKTFYTVMYCRRAYLMRGRPLWIIDQTKDREYKPLVDELGGQWAEVAPDGTLPAIPWTSDVLGISLAPMPRGDARGPVFANLVEQIADAALADRRPRHVVVDEAVVYSTTRTAGEALERLGAEGRHWKVGAIFVSQRVSGFLDTPYGSSVLDNLGSALFLRQKDTEAKRIAQRLELSPAETKFLQRATISATYREGLLVVGDWRLGLKIEASALERSVAATSA